MIALFTGQHEHRRRNQRFLIAWVALVLMAGWTHGVFDQLLWKVGLNHGACATNGYGATFCGDQLKQYQQRFGNR